MAKTEIKPGTEGAEFRNISAMGLTRMASAAHPGEFFLRLSNGKSVPIRSVRITNRAQNGNIKQWFATWSSNFYPSTVEPMDKSTWLQPGESIDVPFYVALQACGNFLAEDKEFNDERDRYVSKVGGWHFEASKPGPRQNADLLNGNIIGPPIMAPDLVIEILDERGKTLVLPIDLQDYWFGERSSHVYSEPNPELAEYDRIETDRRLKALDNKARR